MYFNFSVISLNDICLEIWHSNYARVEEVSLDLFFPLIAIQTYFKRIGYILDEIWVGWFKSN